MSDPAVIASPDRGVHIGGYVAAVIRALEGRGVDVARALAAAGLDRVTTNDPLVRVPIKSVHTLFDIAVAETGDPYFGLHTAEYLHAGNLHALGHSLLASSSLREFGLRLARHFRFLSSGSVLSWIEAPPYAGLRFDSRIEPPAQAQDQFALFLVRLVRELSDGRVNAARVEFNRVRPPDEGFQHRRAFGCPIEFETPTTNIFFDADLLDVPFSGASDEIAAQFDRIVVDYLARLDRKDVQNRVRVMLIKDMPSGSVSKERVAEKLHMSPRTLQIKLAKCGTTFHDILSETCRTLACGYMANSALSVTEIAYMVGYSDTSNFSRAFRRWTGLSPSVYRARFDGQPPVAPSVELPAKPVSVAFRASSGTGR